MICNGVPYIPYNMQNWIEFYQDLYKLNMDIYRIWGSPWMNIWLGPINERKDS